ncbi:Ig-like domain-containing protein, partial [Symbiobacterium thermophilum]|uniref:Ig-like domain-containing protein n=1 Tax=Symbiobacterium thermophilum TaxID=2734 RepID=UPI0023567DF8
VLPRPPVVTDYGGAAALITDEDQPLRLRVRPQNGDDPDRFRVENILGGKLYVSPSGPPSGTDQPLADGAYVSLADGEGNLWFLPDPDLNSRPGSGTEFGFQVRSVYDQVLSDPTPVSITVRPVDDPPVGGPDRVGPFREDSQNNAIAVGDLLKNDAPGPADEAAYDGQTVSLVGVAAGVHGTVTLQGNQILFTPDPDFHGTATFTYTIRDSAGLEADVPVEVEVLPVADTPSVGGGTTREDEPLEGIAVARSDKDGPEVTHFYITGVQGGDVYPPGSSQPVADGSFIRAADVGAGLTFVPAPDAFGESGFGFTVHGAVGESLDFLSPEGARAVIRVIPVNDPPVAVDDDLDALIPQRAVEDGDPITFPAALLTANDSAGPANEAGQGLRVVGVSPVEGVAVSLDEAAQEITFIPDQDFHGTASFTYIVEDDGTTDDQSDPQRSAPATVRLTVEPRADLPEVPQVVTTAEDALSEPIRLAKNANDGDEIAAFRIRNVEGGTLYHGDGKTPLTLADGVATIPADQGEAYVRFLPAPDRHSALGDTFSFQVQAVAPAYSSESSSPSPKGRRAWSSYPTRTATARRGIPSASW